MKIKPNTFTIIQIVVVVLALVIGLGLTYLIATSNLPDWLKWFLLK